MEVSRWKCRLVWKLPQVVLKSRSSTFLNEDIVLIWWETLTFSLYGYTFSRKKFGFVVFMHKPWLNVLKFDTWRGDHLLTLTASQVTLISLELIEKSFSGHSYFTFLILQSVGSNLGSWILISFSPDQYWPDLWGWGSYGEASDIILHCMKRALSNTYRKRNKRKIWTVTIMRKTS